MRKLKKIWVDQEAVSPVIAVILMVAITVVLAAVLYMWAQSFVPTGKNTPIATITTSKSQNNYELYVSSIEPAAAGDSVKYQLLDKNRLPVEQGELNDVYNKVLRNPMDGSILSNVSWRDSNGDDRLSTGDTIVLLGSENDRWNNVAVDPGVAEPGMYFRIVFDPTEKSIASVELT